MTTSKNADNVSRNTAHGDPDRIVKRAAKRTGKIRRGHRKNKTIYNPEDDASGLLEQIATLAVSKNGMVSKSPKGTLEDISQQRFELPVVDKNDRVPETVSPEIHGSGIEAEASLGNNAQEVGSVVIGSTETPQEHSPPGVPEPMVDTARSAEGHCGVPAPSGGVGGDPVEGSAVGAANTAASGTPVDNADAATEGMAGGDVGSRLPRAPHDPAAIPGFDRFPSVPGIDTEPAESTIGPGAHTVHDPQDLCHTRAPPDTAPAVGSTTIERMGATRAQQENADDSAQQENADDSAQQENADDSAAGSATATAPQPQSNAMKFRAPPPLDAANPQAAAASDIMAHTSEIIANTSGFIADTSGRGNPAVADDGASNRSDSDVNFSSDDDELIPMGGGAGGGAGHTRHHALSAASDSLAHVRASLSPARDQSANNAPSPLHGTFGSPRSTTSSPLNATGVSARTDTSMESTWGGPIGGLDVQAVARAGRASMHFFFPHDTSPPTSANSSMADMSPLLLGSPRTPARTSPFGGQHVGAPGPNTRGTTHLNGTTTCGSGTPDLRRRVSDDDNSTAQSGAAVHGHGGDQPQPLSSLVDDDTAADKEAYACYETTSFSDPAVVSAGVAAAQHASTALTLVCSPMHCCQLSRQALLSFVP